MKKIVHYVPNAITLSAMLCGILSITASFHGAYEAASRAILIASLLDVLDGWIARLTHSSSRLGVKLDSISDFCSFCVAPAVLLAMQEVYPNMTRLGFVSQIGFGVCMVFIVCGGYRLVRFTGNADGAESKTFMGMPTTAAAITLASGMGMSFDFARFFSNPHYVYAFVCVWLTLTFVLSLLMVSRVPYEATKSAISSRPHLPIKVALALIALFVALVVFVPVVLFILSIIYMFHGMFRALSGKSKAEPAVPPEDEKIGNVDHPPREAADSR